MRVRLTSGRQYRAGLMSDVILRLITGRVNSHSSLPLVGPSITDMLQNNLAILHCLGYYRHSNHDV